MTPPFNSIDEYKAYIRQKAKEYRDRHRNDPAFKRKERERNAKWQRENPDKVRKNREKYYNKKRTT